MLWRPVVHLSSSAERVRVELGPEDRDVEPVHIETDRTRMELGIGREHETVTHAGSKERLEETAHLVASKARTAVTRAAKSAGCARRSRFER